MNKIYVAILVLIVLLASLLAVRFILGGNEDDWIKDENGIYVEHGSPDGISDEVLEQQELILEALKLYYQKQAEGMEFSSQCLGDVGDYAIDVVHVPRISDDDLEENQCESYITGKVKHFIELDISGNVVRIE